VRGAWKAPTSLPQDRQLLAPAVSRPYHQAAGAAWAAWRGPHPAGEGAGPEKPQAGQAVRPTWPGRAGAVHRPQRVTPSSVTVHQGDALRQGVLLGPFANSRSLSRGLRRYYAREARHRRWYSSL
jgi:hypothetical protein